MAKTTRNDRKNSKRITVSFSLDPDVAAFVRKGSRNGSASERLNQIIRRIMRLELEEQLGREAAVFFASVTEEDRKESREWQKASMKTWARN